MPTTRHQRQRFSAKDKITLCALVELTEQYYSSTDWFGTAQIKDRANLLMQQGLIQPASTTLSFVTASLRKLTELRITAMSRLNVAGRRCNCYRVQHKMLVTRLCNSIMSELAPFTNECDNARSERSESLYREIVASLEREQLYANDCLNGCYYLGSIHKLILYALYKLNNTAGFDSVSMHDVHAEAVLLCRESTVFEDSSVVAASVVREFLNFCVMHNILNVSIRAQNQVSGQLCAMYCFLLRPNVRGLCLALIAEVTAVGRFGSNNNNYDECTQAAFRRAIENAVAFQRVSGNAVSCICGQVANQPTDTSVVVDLESVYRQRVEQVLKQTKS